MNLHDWIDELCDTLELEDVEVDESLLADVGEVATRTVDRHAAPVTAYLLGLAAAARHAGPQQVEELADRVRRLAVGWGRPPVARADEPPADEGAADYSDELDLGAADDREDTDDRDRDPADRVGAR